MIVICLEGSHGCGKSVLCRLFSEAGFWTLDEAFLDMPEYALHPQSLLMETSWVCSCIDTLRGRFERVLKRASEADHKNEIYIADRSPFSACYYASNGHLLKDVITEQMNEVREAADIHIFTVHLRVEKERLWGRILNRLRREPHRAKYNEDKRSWMEATLDFYDNFGWDMVVDNNEITLTDLMHQVLRTLSVRSPMFQEAVMACVDTLAPGVVAAASPITVGSPVGFHTGDSMDATARPEAVAGKTTKPLSQLQAVAAAMGESSSSDGEDGDASGGAGSDDLGAAAYAPATPVQGIKHVTGTPPSAASSVSMGSVMSP